MDYVKKYAKYIITLALSITIVGFVCVYFFHQKSFEKRAVALVSKIPGVKKPITAKKLVGGHTEAYPVKVITPDQSYVVRFLDDDNYSTLHQEITCQKIASEQGYGPRIYLISSEERAIVMEFLHQELFPSDKNRLEALVTLVKRIHTGLAFPSNWSLVDAVRSGLHMIIDRNLTKEFPYFSQSIEITEKMYDALQRYSYKTACHRDLNPDNVLYARGQFYAIDFKTAGQDDPYVDLAELVFWHSSDTGKKEEDCALQVLEAYYGRAATEEEKNHLLLQRIMVRLYYSLISLHLDSDAEIKQDKDSRVSWGNTLASDAIALYAFYSAHFQKN